MNFRSIRFRLTAWYFAIFALGLSLFSVGAWFAMRASLLHAIDHDLRDRIAGVKKFMTALPANELGDEFQEHSMLGSGADLLQVCDAQSHCLYRSGLFEMNNAGIRTPREIGTSTLYENIQVTHIFLRAASEIVNVNGKVYTVQVAAPMHEFHEALENFALLLTLFIPLLLLIAAAGGYILSGRALSPVDQITKAARSISIQNLSNRLSVPHTGDELERLSSTLNAMLQRLDGAVRRMTQFTADASHELRAPLALIRTTAEVALRKERTLLEYREAISQVLAESERTSELVGSLLMLARADAGKDNPPLAPMDLTESVREAFEQGQTLAVEKGIKLESGIPPHPVNIEGDPQAIRRVFLILIDNAIKYTGKNGVVNVSLSTFNGTVKGVVRDSGIGISDRDQPYLFDRFWRADKVRSRELGGIGLGLSIAKVIVERHGGRIEVKSTLGGGSAFSVEFPATSKKSE